MLVQVNRNHWRCRSRSRSRGHRRSHSNWHHECEYGVCVCAGSKCIPIDFVVYEHVHAKMP